MGFFDFLFKKREKIELSLRPQSVAGKRARVTVDKNNHAMKAIAYGLIDRYGVVENKPQLTGMLAQGIVKGWH